jgi:hypothetical protein
VAVRADGSGLRQRLPARPLYGQADQRDRRRVMLGDPSGCGTCPNPGDGLARCRSSPLDCSGKCWYLYCVIFQLRHHLGEYLLGRELVPVGAAHVLTDGGDKLAELVIAGDPELNPTGAAADVPG